MLTSLDPASQKIDVAVALTEALIAGIAKGRTDYKLVGSYVRTSLNWAVITGTDAKADAYQSISDLRGTRIGISRIGSGSQLMASVMALQQFVPQPSPPSRPVRGTDHVSHATVDGRITMAASNPSSLSVRNGTFRQPTASVSLSLLMH